MTPQTPMALQTFEVDGLRCLACVTTVTDTLLAVDAVHAVDVTLGSSGPSTVRVEAEHHLGADVIQRALATRGDFRIRLSHPNGCNEEDSHGSTCQRSV